MTIAPDEKSITYNLNGIITRLGSDFTTLSRQKRDLDQITEPNEMLDAETLAALYTEMAEKFENEYSYDIIAGACHRRAAYWKARVL